MKFFYLIFLISISANTYAANYDYIDAGDYYYINKFGKNNLYVQVIRKLGSQEVKVRDQSSYETSIVSAHLLLTKSELEAEEFENKAKAGVVVGAIFYCAFNPNKCKE